MGAGDGVPGGTPPAVGQALAIALPRLADRWRGGELDDAGYAAAYFLHWRIARHGRRFASRRAKSDPRPDPEEWLRVLAERSGEPLRAALMAWFARHQFLGVIPAVAEAFLGWLRDGWDLRLHAGIPAPEAVLRMQAAGQRPVTVLADYPRALRPVLGKADGCAFLVHDLEHGWKFFHDAELHAGQRRLFRLLLAATEAGRFAPYRAESRFSAQFDYLISDMNTHPVHALRYLCAVLIEAVLRREGKAMDQPLSEPAAAELAALLRGLAELWDFPAPALAALLRLLDGGFGPAEAACLDRAVRGTATDGGGGPACRG